MYCCSFIYLFIILLLFLLLLVLFKCDFPYTFVIEKGRGRREDVDCESISLLTKQMESNSWSQSDQRPITSWWLTITFNCDFIWVHPWYIWTRDATMNPFWLWTHYAKNTPRRWWWWWSLWNQSRSLSGNAKQYTILALILKQRSFDWYTIVYVSINQASITSIEHHFNPHERRWAFFLFAHLWNCEP